MDLPCFLLSWLRNLQLIPLTQSHTSWRRRLGIPNWEEKKRVMISFFTGSQELFDHIKAIPQIWHPKTFNWSQKGRWSFGSLCCFDATHSRLETLKNIAYLEIIFTNYPSSVVCLINEMKYLYFFQFSAHCIIMLEGKKITYSWFGACLEFLILYSWTSS